MAGKRLGTVFVEMGMDSTQFTKAQVDILNASLSTALESEKNFRTLGTQSDLIFNTMRQNVQSSLGAIVASSKSSEDEITRAKQAAADKIAAIDAQQFGSQKSFIDTAKENWAAFAVAAVAAWEMVQKGMEYVDLGAKAQQVESSFKIMSDAAGVNSESLIESMKEATRSTIDDSDLMQKAVKLMLAGYDAQQIKDFSAVAITASEYAGVTVGEAFDRLGDAIANKTPKALVQLGALTKEQMPDFTAAIKGGADQSDVMALALDNLALKGLQLQGTENGATLAVQQFHAQTVQTKEEIGTGIIRVMEIGYGVFQAFGVASLTVSAGLWEVARGAASAAAMTTALIPGMGDFSAKMQGMADSYKDNAEQDFAAALKLKDQAVTNFTGVADVAQKASDDQIKAGKDKVAADMANLEKFKNTKADEAAVLTSLTKQYQDSYDSQVSKADLAYKAAVAGGENELTAYTAMTEAKRVALNTWFDEQAANIDTHTDSEVKAQAQLDALYAEYGKKWTANEAKLAENKIGYEQKKTDATVQAYQLIDKYGDAAVEADKEKLLKQYTAMTSYLDPSSGAYTAAWESFYKAVNKLDLDANDARQKSLQTYVTWETDTLNKQIAVAKSIGGTRVSMNSADWDAMIDYQKMTGVVMTADQRATAQLTLDEYKNTFVGGAQAALLDLQKSQLTWGQASYQTVMNFTTASASTLSTFFKDAWAGNLKSASDYFSSFATDMVGKMADMVSGMIAKWAVLGASDWVKTGMASVSSYVGSFEEGTLNVPSTGNATLHEGEMVLTKGLANEVRSALTANATSNLTGAGMGVAGLGGVIGGVIGSYFGNMIGGKTGGAIGGIAGSVGGVYGGAALADYLGMNYGAAAASIAEEDAAIGAAAAASETAGAGAAAGAGSLGGGAAAAPIAIIAGVWSDLLFGTNNMQGVHASLDSLFGIGAGTSWSQLTNEQLAADIPGAYATYENPAIWEDGVVGSQPNDDWSRLNGSWSLEALREYYNRTGKGYNNESYWYYGTEFGGGYPAKGGMDAEILDDGFMIQTHRGERAKVWTAEETSTMKNGGGQGGGFNGDIHVYLDGQEIGGRVKVIADGVVVERNNRNVNPTTRVYI